jgi:hypothetical protein
MATTTFGLGLKKEIKVEIDDLLGRIIPAMPCPMDEAQIENFWNGMLPRDIQDAYYRLLKANFATGSLTSPWGIMVIDVGPFEAMVHLHSEDRLLVIPAEMQKRLSRRDARYNYKEYIYRPDRESLFHSCPIVFNDFIKWAMQWASTERDFNDAYDTICKLIDMCSTVGQLKRMVPDIADYLPPEKQLMIRNQQRASSMPYDWATFERSKVDQALNAMAKCYLLPAARLPIWSCRTNFSRAEIWVEL